MSIKETKDYLASRRPDAMRILETKVMEEDSDDEEWDMTGYEKFEVRRSELAGDRKGGGIMIYARAKEGLEFKELRMKKLSEVKRGNLKGFQLKSLLK